MYEYYTSSDNPWCMDGVCPPLVGQGGEILVPPVDESTPSLGFGIAVSGGTDNPHFTSGDPAIVISDVVPNGPAWGLLQWVSPWEGARQYCRVNDRILSANGLCFEGISYGRAVDLIKHSEQINMIVRRRVAVPVMEFEQRTLKFTLTKSRKKDDFGIVLGCKFYIKEIRNPKLAEKDPGLKEGDTILRINGQSVEGASMDDCCKWLDRSRDKLCLVIQRDVRRGSTRWPSTQTVYERVGSVAATPRHSPSPMHQPLSQRSSHEYINSPRWRDESERRVSDSERRVSDSDYSRTRGDTDRGVRTVCFNKVGGSVGVRVVGGNDVGIYVSAVASDSPAALHGVCCGDRILEVNGRPMGGVTREEAVQLLLSLDERVILKLEHARSQFENIRHSQIGDNFFIRAHFNKEKKSSPLEMPIAEGDIFHVTDTLFGGTVGLWQAARVYSAAGRTDGAKGVIPNFTSAESHAREARRISEKGGGKATLLRRKLESRRTKSLPKNMLGDPSDVGSVLALPVYERVVLNTPAFHRPVVLYGPLADVARQQLLSHFALRFAVPEGDGVIRLSAVDAVIASGKHCVLDIGIDSVERLQLAQYAPIIILIDVDGRNRIREIRKKLDAPRVSTKKLMEQASTIKKHHCHLLSATVDATHEEGWFEAVRELIAHLQQRRLWMPEFAPSLPLEDILLFPLSSNGTDSDVESKGDYVEYTTRKEDAARWSTLPKRIHESSVPPMNRINNDGWRIARDTLRDKTPIHSSPGSSPKPDRKLSGGASAALSTSALSSGYYQANKNDGEQSILSEAAKRLEAKKCDENADTVLEQTTCVVGHQGATLTCPASKVSLVVPPGAIQQGEQHEIYIKVYEEGSCPIDPSKGEQVMSPLVMCGPQGLRFLVPLELRLPNTTASADQWAFSLKTGEGGEWRSSEVAPVETAPFLSIPIHSF